MLSLRSLGALLLFTSSALFAGGCEAEDAAPSPTAERDQAVEPPQVDACFFVMCRPDSHCESDRGVARCVPDLFIDVPLCPGLGTRNARTGDCECDARTLCREGTEFDSDPSVCACTPRRPECLVDEDCSLFSDYCGFCACRALAGDERGPSCAGSQVECLIDPCDQKKAICSKGSCQVSPVRQGEMCGSSFCAPGEVCCNFSCGICTPPGGVCTEQLCFPELPAAGRGPGRGGSEVAGSVPLVARADPRSPVSGLRSPIFARRKRERERERERGHLPPRPANAAARRRPRAPWRALRCSERCVRLAHVHVHVHAYGERKSETGDRRPETGERGSALATCGTQSQPSGAWRTNMGRPWLPRLAILASRGGNPARQERIGWHRSR